MKERAAQEERAPAPEILVLGLGNLLLRDEGAGVHAVRAFQACCPRGVTAVDAGTAVLRVENLLASAAFIIAFDALQAGSAPGTVYASDASGVLDAGVRHSLHEYGLLQALQAARKNPVETLILGVEPEVVDYGCDLSAPVQAAIPKLVALALAAIARRHASRTVQ